MAHIAIGLAHQPDTSFVGEEGDDMTALEGAFNCFVDMMSRDACPELLTVAVFEGDQVLMGWSVTRGRCAWIGERNEKGRTT